MFCAREILCTSVLQTWNDDLHAGGEKSSTYVCVLSVCSGVYVQVCFCLCRCRMESHYQKISQCTFRKVFAYCVHLFSLYACELRQTYSRSFCTVCIRELISWRSVTYMCHTEQFLPCMSSLRSALFSYVCVQHVRGMGTESPFVVFYQGSKLSEPTEAKSVQLIAGLMRWGCCTVFPTICWSLINCRGLL